MEPTNTQTWRKVFCPTHKAAFDAPSQSRVVCEIVEHILTDNLARAEYWEYCCNCQTYWPSHLGQGGPAAIDCPSCGRDFARRYLCHECKLLSVESDEAAKGKIHSITTLGISPNCPNCESAPGLGVQEHLCADAQSLLSSARETCPFCEVSLVKPNSAPPTWSLGPPCRNCHRRSEAGFDYCMFCGETLSPIAVAASVSPVLPSATAPTAFLSLDATIVSFETNAVPPPSIPPVMRSNINKLIVVVAALVMAAFLVVILATSLRKNNASTQEVTGNSSIPVTFPTPQQSAPVQQINESNYETCVLSNNVAGFSRVNVRRNCDTGDCAEIGRYSDNTQVKATEERVDRYVKGRQFTFRKIYINDNEFWVAEKKLRCN